MKETYISRKHYQQLLQPFMHQPLIKVIIGQRRVGKSYFLLQLMDLLRTQTIPEARILYINKESHDFNMLRNASDLIQYVEHQRGRSTKKIYLFIDEIQEIEKFENALRHFQTTGNYDLYCSGSTAQLFSSELATRLGGRAIEFQIFALSYSEFLEFHQVVDTPETFMLYLKYGGLPYLVHLPKNDQVIFEYLRSVFNTILLTDVVQRHSVRNISFLERLVEYISDNTGSIVSAKRISNFLKSQKLNISPQLVINYLAHLTDALLIHRVPRSYVQGKKIFEVWEKYYFGDLGLRNAIIGYRQADMNKLLENIVYLHLRIAGYTVTIGQLPKKEIDFVAEKSGERMYVQVSYLLHSEKVRNREFGNLLEINDHYPKYVVSMDEGAGGTVRGVQHVHIRKFLQDIVQKDQ